MMKKVGILFSMLAVAFMFGITSCGDDKPIVIPPGDDEAQPVVEAVEGKIVLVMQVPKVDCNVSYCLTGNFAGWTTPSGDCEKFTLVEGKTTWYSIVLDKPEEGTSLVVQGAVIQSDGTSGWEYQWKNGTLEVLEGDADFVDNGFDAFINLEFLASATVVYIKVGEWRTAPCLNIEKNKAGTATFTLTATNVPEGATIGVVGNFPERNWDITNPFVMTFAGGKYTATIEVGDAQEYKYFLKVAGGEWDWAVSEDGGNRHMPVSLKAVDEVNAWVGLGI